MSTYNVYRSSGSRLILVTLLLCIILSACGDQNTPIVSQGAAAIGPQTTPNPAVTTVSSKATPKGGATTAKAAAGVLHICSLLTKNEVAASLGGTVAVDAASDSLGEFGQATCNYTNSTGGLTVQVSITGQSKADFENSFKTLGGQAVPGLGDSAFFTGGQLSTLKGKVGLVIFLVNPVGGGSTVLSNATDLTNKVLTALGKSNHASDVTSAAATGNSVTAADIPVYPGSVQVDNRSSFGTQLATFTSADDYTTIVSWFKKIIADNNWTGTVTLEPETDDTIISAGKATANTSSRLLVSIEGPKKADRGTISDNNGNPVVLNPNDTLIVVTLR